MNFRRSSHYLALPPAFLVPCIVLSLLLSQWQFQVLVPGTASAAAEQPTKLEAGQKAQVSASYAKLPLSFEANHGQFDSQVKFVSRQPGFSLSLNATEAAMNLQARNGGRTVNAYLRMLLVGCNRNARIGGIDPLPGKVNYFLGNDPQQWRTDVPTYGRVKSESVYPGVDLVFYGNGQQLEYDFVVAPGGNPKAIKLKFNGARRLRLDRGGDLLLETEAGEIRQHKPFVYQVTEQGKQEIASRYKIQGDQVSFALGAHDISRPLVIDPVLSYSTFLGGNATDIAESIAIDAKGNAYVTGWTGAGGHGASTFPITPGAIRSHQTMGAHGGTYIFVTKLNSDGSALVYSAVIGGTLGRAFYDSRGNLQSVLENRAKSIAVDPQGYAYVAGSTRSNNFPTTPGAVQSAPVAADVNEAFALRLNLTGSALVYSTRLGQGEAEALGIGVDGQGQAWVAGLTSSRLFPVTADAFQKTPKNRNYSAFVSKLNPTGTQLLYATYLTSGSADLATAIAVDGSGNAYVTGWTGSSCDRFPVDPFPTTEGAFRRDLGTGCVEPGTGTFVYLTKFNANGALAYSTLIGDGRAHSVAVDSTGNAYITGKTFKGVDFPTTPGAFQREAEGVLYTETAYATKLNSSGSALVYSTYLNGAAGNPDRGPAIAVTASGDVCLTGTVSGTNFVTTTKDGPFQPDRGLWVLKLNAAGNAPAYSVVLGGIDSFGQGIAVDTSGDAFIAGYTRSVQFPTTPGAFQRQLGSQETNTHDAFITKIRASAEARMATHVSAASYAGTPLAGEAIIAAFGTELAVAIEVAVSVPLPITLAGTTVKVKDGLGVERAAPLFFVSPTQVNYLLPAGTANGAATISITSGDGTVSTAEVMIENVAPSLFSADAGGRGLAAAVALRINSNGAQSYEPVAQYDLAQSRMMPAPVDLGADGEQVFLILYGTGFRHHTGLANLVAKIGGIEAQVQYAGTQGDFYGLDQVNVLIPRSLVGRGEAGISLTVDGKNANTVKVWIK